MVTGGNVTGLTDELEPKGSSCAKPIPATAAPASCGSRPRASARSTRWPREHEQWVDRAVRGLDAAERDRALRAARQLQATIRERDGDADDRSRRRNERDRSDLAAGNRRRRRDYRRARTSAGRSTTAWRPSRSNRPGAQEPADLRVVCRAARPVSRLLRLRRRRQGGGGHRRRRATSAPAATCTRSSAR